MWLLAILYPQEPDRFLVKSEQSSVTDIQKFILQRIRIPWYKKRTNSLKSPDSKKCTEEGIF